MTAFNFVHISLFVRSVNVINNYLYFSIQERKKRILCTCVSEMEIIRQQFFFHDYYKIFKWKTQKIIIWKRSTSKHSKNEWKEAKKKSFRLCDNLSSASTCLLLLLIIQFFLSFLFFSRVSPSRSMPLQKGKKKKSNHCSVT